ncbi:Uncharacterised protein [Mycobacteroides abscessus subsp. abscessus]|nr:Uncharacterised protein [Mycobacteroides abscessus subsp. abscessus]
MVHRIAPGSRSGPSTTSPTISRTSSSPQPTLPNIRSRLDRA